MDDAQTIKSMLPGVKVVRQVERSECDFWARLTTYPRLNKRLFALLVFIAATRRNPLISRFAVELDDGNSCTWYGFSPITGHWDTAATAPDWVSVQLIGPLAQP
jgi:hypothetical protein